MRQVLLASLVLLGMALWPMPQRTPAESPVIPESQAIPRYAPHPYPLEAWAPPARREHLTRPFTWSDMGLNGASPGRQLADL